MPLSTSAAMQKDKTTGKSVELQHRHFAFIAAVIADIPDHGQRCDMALHFGAALRSTNPKFDLDRFILAALPV